MRQLGVRGQVTGNRLTYKCVQSRTHQGQHENNADNITTQRPRKAGRNSNREIKHDIASNGKWQE